MANVELLMETLQYIKDNPQRWLQEAWFALIDPKTGSRVWDLELIDVEEVNSCGTAFCFAGHAALKSGFCDPPKNPHSPWRMKINGNVVHVDDYAADKLDISYEQSSVLFNGGNSLEDLEKIVNAIIENPEISLEDLEILIGRYGDGTCPCCVDDEYDDDDDVW